MSYDFELFRRRADEDPRVTARRDPEDIGATPLDPKKEALKRKVAEALILHNPDLEISKFDYEAIAKLEKISVEEARLKYRHLELNVAEYDCNGIQITLFDDEASVTVPYWHEGDKAKETFQEIWNYLWIICRETGYLIYDPQIDQFIEPSTGFDAALAYYADWMRKLR
jgi:hypothetical protein